MVAITLDDTHLLFDNGTNTVKAQRWQIEFGPISGDNLPLYWERITGGSSSITLDYNTTTVEGITPADASNMKELIIELLLSSGPGPIKRKLIYKTAGYEVKPTDDIIICDGTFTVTLHTAVGYEGVQHVIQNEGTGTVKVQGDGVELIADSNEQDLIQYEALTIVSDDTNWQVI